MTIHKLATALSLAAVLPTAALLAQPPQDQLIRDQLGARDCGADCITRQNGAASQTGERLFNRGLRELHKMKYPKAAKTFSRAVKHAPDNSVFNYMAGSALFLSGDRSAALPYLQKSLEIGDDPALSASQHSIAQQMIAQIGVQASAQ